MASEGVKRDERGRLLPGTASPNPGGMAPEVAEARRLLAEHVPKAIEVLVALLDSEEPKVRGFAAREILDRTIGKPKQAHELVGDTPTIVAELLKRFASSEDK